MTSPKSKPANRPRAFKSNRPPAPSKSKRSGSPKSNRPKSNRPESPKVKIIHLPPPNCWTSSTTKYRVPKTELHLHQPVNE